MEDKDCCGRAFRASSAKDDLEGTFGGIADASDAGGGIGSAKSCEGVREPLGEAVGGGSDDSKRCSAVSDGDGLTTGGGTRSICGSESRQKDVRATYFLAHL